MVNGNIDKIVFKTRGVHCSINSKYADSSRKPVYCCFALFLQFATFSGKNNNKINLKKIIAATQFALCPKFKTFICYRYAQGTVVRILL